MKIPARVLHTGHPPLAAASSPACVLGTDTNLEHRPVADTKVHRHEIRIPPAQRRRVLAAARGVDLAAALGPVDAFR